MKGLYGGAGVGYKFMIGQKTAMQTSLGYNHQNNKRGTFKESYSSGALRIGFMF